MAGGGVVFGPRAVQQLTDGYRRSKRVRPETGGGRGLYGNSPTQRCRVAIIGSLAAPADTFGTPETCTAAVLRYSVDLEKLEDSGRRITITNFDESLTADDGTYGKAEFLDGTWELYWLSCSPSAELEDLPEEPFTFGTEEPPPPPPP